MAGDTEFWNSGHLVEACRREGVVAARVYARQHGLTLSLY
jgi:hypothetical protein